MKEQPRQEEYSMSKKTAYYQTYDPSVLEMTEYCIRQDMCNDIGNLEDELFAFGQEMVKLSKSLDGLEKQEIAAKIQDIVKKHCDCYLVYKQVVFMYSAKGGKQ